MDALDVGLVAVVTILVQMLKPIPAIAARHYLVPPLAVALGIVAAYARAGFPADAGLVWGGLVAGLASCGLFAAGRETAGAVKSAREERRDSLT
jgi:hypothetical protein